MAKRRHHKEKKEHHGHIVSILAIIIAIAAIGAIAYSAYSIFYKNAPMAPSIVVTGYVSTLGITTTPSAISFASPKASYYSTITNNRYAISLPGSNAYTVTIYWSSLAGFGSGTCIAGALNLNNSTLLIVSKNFQC